MKHMFLARVNTLLPLTGLEYYLVIEALMKLPWTAVGDELWIPCSVFLHQAQLSVVWVDAVDRVSWGGWCGVIWSIRRININVFFHCCFKKPCFIFFAVFVFGSWKLLSIYKTISFLNMCSYAQIFPLSFSRQIIKKIIHREKDSYTETENPVPLHPRHTHTHHTSDLTIGWKETLCSLFCFGGFFKPQNNRVACSNI